MSENRVVLQILQDFIAPLCYTMSQFVPKMSNFSLLSIAFVVSYFSTFSTPILFGIVQDVSLSEPLCIVLMLCDLGYFIDFLRYWLETSQSEEASGDISGYNKQQRLFHYVVHMLSCSSLFLLPLGMAAGVRGSDLAWISILRMVSKEKRKRKPFSSSLC